MRSVQTEPEATPRVCVIDSERVRPAINSFARAHLEIAAVLPRFVELNAAALSQFDTIVVTCDEKLLLSGHFQQSVRRMSRVRPVIALVDGASPNLAIEAARAGFRGLLLPTATPTVVDRTVRAVLRGELAFSRSTLSALADPAVAERGHAASQLTVRQRQVVELVAKGATDEQIGRELGISASTAHKHVLGALRRLNARSRGQLVATVAQT